MLQRMISIIQLVISRKSLKVVLKSNHQKSEEVMKTYETILLNNNQLNEDFTEGPVPPRNNISRDLIASFVLLRDHREDEDFYIQVANKWVKKES